MLLPGTGVAAIATGSIHALIGALGMLLGGIFYALSFGWVRSHILPVGNLGNLRLPGITGISDWGWFGILIVIAAIVFRLLERKPALATR